ncbi:unnamed protein product [Ectocarpus sp. 6 AP-2014]
MAPWRHRLLVLGASFVASARGSSTFICDGGATALEQNKVNDDYCDCLDGADETLTPACSHTGQARFACTDTGSLNQTIPTSRLWDGVCDCCDGSDELVELGGIGERSIGAAAAVGTAGSAARARATATCDRNGCERVLEDARTTAMEAVEAGLEARKGAEERSERVVAEWQATLNAGEVDEEVRKQELKAMEKLEVLLKVYLQDEERKERRERVQLAEQGRCETASRREGGDGQGGAGRRAMATALGPCEDNSAEREAATKVRAARAAARARRDADEGQEQKNKNKNKKRNSSRGDRDRGGSGGEGGRERNRGSGGGALEQGASTVEDILGLEWVVDVSADDDDGAFRDRGTGENREPGGGSGSGTVNGGGGRDREEEDAQTTALSLKTYVKQRQAGSAAANGGQGQAKAGEKRAEELRKTALLGPVLNDGERGVYLGLTILLRLAGLPLLSPLRGLAAAFGFLRDRAARAAAGLAASESWGLAPASTVRVALEGYRDRGLPGISPHLDYRRYPTLRSVVLHWDEFLHGNGKFLLVMWDAPVALWNFCFPYRDDKHERPEAAMLREGIARARAILQEKKPDTAGRGGRGKRRREESEAKRLSGLDLGEGSRFAALAEKCLDLEEGGYLYSLCTFKEAKQDKHSLGRWRGWGPGGRGRAGRGRDRVMLFDGGSRCHNNKQRSCEVSVQCGSEDALVAAEEIEIGTYRLRLETPLACTEAHLAEAERGLEALGLVRPSARGGLRPEEEGAFSSSGRVEGCGTAGAAGVCDEREL